MFFEGFTLQTLEANGQRVRLRLGLATARRCCCCTATRRRMDVAPGRAGAGEGFTVIAPDLRGYGDSSKPPARPTCALLQARDGAGQVEVMQHSA